MNKVILTAVILIVLGLTACFVGVRVLDFDIMSLDGRDMQTNTYTPEESFSSILLITQCSDVLLVPAEDDRCTVICYEQSNQTHTVRVVEDTLWIEGNDNRKWYDHINLFSFKQPKITVHLPKEEYTALSANVATGDLDMPKGITFGEVSVVGTTGDVTLGSDVRGMARILLSTGDIQIKQIHAERLDLTVTTGQIKLETVECDGSIKLQQSTGDAELTDVTCESISAKGTTGDAELNRVVATGSISVQLTTGDVKLDRSDARQLNIKVNTGDVTGSLLTEKIFVAQSDTGSVKVPHTTGGGTCEIITKTGSIRISLAD